MKSILQFNLFKRYKGRQLSLHVLSLSQSLQVYKYCFPVIQYSNKNDRFRYFSIFRHQHFIQNKLRIHCLNILYLKPLISNLFLVLPNLTVTQFHNVSILYRQLLEFISSYFLFYPFPHLRYLLNFCLLLRIHSMWNLIVNTFLPPIYSYPRHSLLSSLLIKYMAMSNIISLRPLQHDSVMFSHQKIPTYTFKRSFLYHLSLIQQEFHSTPVQVIRPNPSFHSNTFLFYRPTKSKVEMPTKIQIKRHFINAMIPMVGFGFMDNLIMLQAGEVIDTSIGVTFGLSTLTAAAVGQIFSDMSGVCFGGVVSAMANSLGFPKTSLSLEQQQLTKMKCIAMSGRLLGILIGCLLGMSSLLLMDLEQSQRLRRFKELQPILKTLILHTQRSLNVSSCRIFLLGVDHLGEEILYPVGNPIQTSYTYSPTQMRSFSHHFNKPIIHKHPIKNHHMDDVSYTHHLLQSITHYIKYNILSIFTLQRTIPKFYIHSNSSPLVHSTSFPSHVSQTNTINIYTDPVSYWVTIESSPSFSSSSYPTIKTKSNDCFVINSSSSASSNDTQYGLQYLTDYSTSHTIMTNFNNQMDTLHKQTFLQDLQTAFPMPLLSHCTDTKRLSFSDPTFNFVHYVAHTGHAIMRYKPHQTSKDRRYDLQANTYLNTQDVPEQVQIPSIVEQAILYYPIFDDMDKERVIGVIELVDKQQRPQLLPNGLKQIYVDMFTRDDERLIKMLSEHLSLYLALGASYKHTEHQDIDSSSIDTLGWICPTITSHHSLRS